MNMMEYNEREETRRREEGREEVMLLYGRLMGGFGGEVFKLGKSSDRQKGL